MISLSLCMIVKNEEATLARCLESARGIADEIIIADTGSSDNTRSIALSFGAKVYDFPWCDDFSAARNFSFSKAAMSHCIWLDADDVIEEQDRQSLISLKGSLPEDVDVVMLPYNAAFDESGKASFSYYRERIVRNSPGWRWQGAVHEVIVPHGKIEYYTAAICHKKQAKPESGRNLRIYRRLIADGNTLSARDRFYFGRELFYAGEYAEAKEVLSELIKSGEGWIENRAEAYRTLAGCCTSQAEALSILLQSFAECGARAEICCDIAAIFKDSGNLPDAIFWYKAALLTEYDPKSGGFIDSDCHGFIPYIQLCVCYDRMGERETAQHYNELAGKVKPYSKAYLQNREYFQKTNESVQTERI